MKYLKSMALAAGFIAFGAIAAQAEGVDEINPDVAKRLYNPDMLDPSQPVDASPLPLSWIVRLALICLKRSRKS